MQPTLNPRRSDWHSDQKIARWRSSSKPTTYVIACAVHHSAAHAYGSTGNDADVMTEVGLIGERVVELFDRMRNGISPSRVAELWARKKLGMA